MSKQTLLETASSLSKEYQEKKEGVLNILNDLDKINGFGEKHVGGMEVVNDLLKEMEVIEKKHTEIIEQIKK